MQIYKIIDYNFSPILKINLSSDDWLEKISFKLNYSQLIDDCLLRKQQKIHSGKVM